MSFGQTQVRVERKHPSTATNRRRSIVYVLLAPVVRKVDSAIHWINYYPLDSAIGCRNTYPLDSDLSGR